MAATSPARAAGFAYVIVLSAVAAGLILVGSLLDRVVPARVSAAYERVAFAAMGWLARPVDRVGCRPADRRPLPGDTTD